MKRKNKLFETKSLTNYDDEFNKIELQFQMKDFIKGQQLATTTSNKQKKKSGRKKKSNRKKKLKEMN